MMGRAIAVPEIDIATRATPVMTTGSVSRDDAGAPASDVVPAGVLLGSELMECPFGRRPHADDDVTPAAQPQLRSSGHRRYERPALPAGRFASSGRASSRTRAGSDGRACGSSAGWACGTRT